MPCQPNKQSSYQCLQADFRHLPDCTVPTLFPCEWVLRLCIALRLAVACTANCSLPRGGERSAVVPSSLHPSRQLAMADWRGTTAQTSEVRVRCGHMNLPRVDHCGRWAGAVQDDCMLVRRRPSRKSLSEGHRGDRSDLSDPWKHALCHS